MTLLLQVGIDPVIKELLNYGVLGIMVVLLIWYIRYLHRAHERTNELREIERENAVERLEHLSEEHATALKVVNASSVQAIQQHTEVMKDLRRLIESSIPRRK